MSYIKYVDDDGVSVAKTNTRTYKYYKDFNLLRVYDNKSGSLIDTYKPYTQDISTIKYKLKRNVLAKYNKYSNEVDLTI